MEDATRWSLPRCMPSGTCCVAGLPPPGLLVFRGQHLLEPVRVGGVLRPLEGVLAEEHDVEHHAAAPHIRQLPVVRPAVGDHLRGCARMHAPVAANKGFPGASGFVESINGIHPACSHNHLASTDATCWAGSEPPACSACVQHQRQLSRPPHVALLCRLPCAAACTCPCICRGYRTKPHPTAHTSGAQLC